MNKSDRNGKMAKIIAGVVCGIVVVAAIAVCAAYYLTGKNLQTISIKEYITASKTDTGYSVMLDYDALVKGEHLPSQSNVNSPKGFDYSRYPELEVLKGIVFLVEPTTDGKYNINYAIVSDKTQDQIYDILNGAGLRLSNTSWTWDAAAMELACEPSKGYPRTIDVRQFLIVTFDSQTQTYAVSMDTNALLVACGFDNLPQTDVKVGAIMSLGFLSTDMQDGSYSIELCSTNENIESLLLQAQIDLSNTTWTLTQEQMQAAAGAIPTMDSGYPRTIDLEQFMIVTLGTSPLLYSVNMDTTALIKACGFENLPQTEQNVQTMVSLGFITTANADGSYSVELSSTNERISELLYAAQINLSATKWTYTAEQMLIKSSQTAPSATAPVATIEPSTTPVVTDEPTPTPTVTPTPTATTAAPTNAPVINTDTTGCITSLYGYDQTAVRKAIRTAKTSYYSGAFKDSEVVYNYFIVRKTETAEYANCFRLVLQVTTSGGTEYMVADVYNIKANTDPKASEVVTHIYTTKTNAKGTSDFNSSLYTVYTLDGGSMVFSDNDGNSPFNSDGLVFSDSLDTKLTTAQLWNIPATNSRSLLSLLGYARNEIFARCGHKFKDTSNYYTYYSGFSWYKPTGSVDFNGVGAKCSKGCDNITLIKEIENLIKVG